jgi:hypothetical protein
VLSRLRKIDGETIKISEDMPITYDISQDYLYNKGIEHGIKKEKVLIVKNLIINPDFDDDKIVLISGATKALIQKVRKELNRKK